MACPTTPCLDGESAHSPAVSMLLTFRKTAPHAPGPRSPLLEEPWAEWSARSWCMEPKAEALKWSNCSAAHKGLTRT